MTGKKISHVVATSTSTACINVVKVEFPLYIAYMYAIMNTTFTFPVYRELFYVVVNTPASPNR